MTSVTFDGIALVRPSFPEIDREPLTKVTTLLSGKRSVQSSPELGFSATFTCVTGSYSDITSLLAKVGYSGTLVIDGVSYTNCYIDLPWKEKKIDDVHWQYTVKFARDTS